MIRRVFFETGRVAVWAQRPGRVAGSGTSLRIMEGVSGMTAAGGTYVAGAVDFGFTGAGGGTSPVAGAAGTAGAVGAPVTGALGASACGTAGAAWTGAGCGAAKDEGVG